MSMKGQLHDPDQGDPHVTAQGLWRPGAYTDENGAEWNILLDGEGLWHVQPADDATAIYYNGLDLKKGGDYSFAEGLDMAVDTIDALVSAYNQQSANKVKQPKPSGGGGGLLVLVILVALAMSDDRKGRRR